MNDCRCTLKEKKKELKTRTGRAGAARGDELVLLRSVHAGVIIASQSIDPSSEALLGVVVGTMRVSFRKKWAVTTVMRIMASVIHSIMQRYKGTNCS